MVHDLTIEILKQIRDEIRGTNERLEELRADTNLRFEEVNHRLDGMNQRMDMMNQRLDLHGRSIVKLIDEVKGTNERLDNFLTGAHGKAHQVLEDRMESVEARVERLEHPERPDDSRREIR